MASTQCEMPTGQCPILRHRSPETVSMTAFNSYRIRPHTMCGGGQIMRCRHVSPTKILNVNVVGNDRGLESLDMRTARFIPNV